MITRMNKVKLRKKLISKGLYYSLYLDIYPAIIDPKTGKQSRRIFLKNYIYAYPRTKEQSEFNDIVLMEAENERALTEIQIFNPQHNLFNKHLSKMSFSKYFEDECKIRSNHQWVSAYKHFNNYIGDIAFNELNQNIVNGFRSYLLNAKQLKSQKVEKKIGKAASSCYFNLFVSLIDKAFKEKYITSKFEYEFIKVPQNKREHLNKIELIKLAETPCEIDILKRAALFSSMSGLRFGDIKSLKWEDIGFVDTDKPFITKTQNKTGELVSCPISMEALQFCGNQKSSSDYVFLELKRKHIYAPLKKWLSDAGIKKNITFHKFRHTYANYLINNNVDIYGVQQLLGHKSINTTQIYLNMNNERFREQIEAIKLK